MTIEDIEDVKTSMRRQEPQAGDASKQAIDKKKKNTSDRAAELMAKQAEAAGVYRKGYVTPLRTDKPAGIDIDSDKDIDDESTLGDLISKSMGKGPDSDIQPDVDADHEAEVKFYADRGKKSKEIYEAAQKRRKEKGSRTDTGAEGSDEDDTKLPPTRVDELNPVEKAADVYEPYAGEDVDTTDEYEREEFGMDASEEQFKNEYEDQDPVSTSQTEVDGDDGWTKLEYEDGAIWLMSPDGDVLRQEDVTPEPAYKKAFDPDKFKLFDPLLIPKILRTMEEMEKMEKE
jgi:hypothetical protein